jgi:hypothetical protein
MIDQISKLKDHVNVSIMKAVQVDESKDTLCSLGESLYTEYGGTPCKIWDSLHMVY